MDIIIRAPGGLQRKAVGVRTPLVGLVLAAEALEAEPSPCWPADLWVYNRLDGFATEPAHGTAGSFDELEELLVALWDRATP